MDLDPGATRLITSLIRDGVLVFDRDARIRDVNEAFCAMSGFSRAELIGSGRPYPFDLVKAAPELSDAFAPQGGAAPTDLEMTLRRKNGAPFWVRVTASDLQDGAPEAGARVAILQDISKERALEARLHASEERFRLADEAALRVIFDWDLRQERIERSAALAELLGFQPDEADPTHAWWLARIHPDDRPGFSATVQRMVSGVPERLYTAEYRVRHKDGSYRWILSRGIAIRDERGATYRMVGSHADITGRKQAEEAIRRSEQRYRSLVMATAQMVWSTTPDGEVVEDLPSWRAFTGTTYEQIRGRGWLASVHPDDVQRVGEVWTKSLASKRPHENEYRIRAADGSYREVFARGVPVLDEITGEVREWVGTCSDVTALRQAERALGENQERLRAVFEQSTAGIAQLDLEGRFVLANQWLCDLIGYPCDELLTKRMQDITHPDDLPHSVTRLEQSKIDGISYRIEKRYIRKDGSQVWVNVSSNIVRDIAGKPYAVLGVITDISDNKRAEAALHRDAMLLANVRDSVIVTDLNGIITFWNDGATRLFGFEASEMIGRPLSERFPEPSRGEVTEWIAHIAAGEAEFKGEWLDYRKDGSRIWIEAHTRRIVDASGKPVGIMGVSHDITERKRAEQERTELLANEQAARGEMERANRAKDEFLAVLSHELRTPLTPVLTLAQMMERDATLTPDQRESVVMIRRNVELEARLVDDLLDLTKISRSKLDLFLGATDVHQKIRFVAGICDSDIRSKHLNLMLDLAAQRPTVRADGARLQQVFWNLLKNAVKFTPDDGSILIRTRNAGPDVLRILISDTGCGIPPDVLPTIFDAFVQGGRDVTRRHGGLGLGLAISKRLVEMHGGTLTASSEGEGRGCTFTLELPATLPPQSGHPVQAPEGSRVTLQDGNILLVEDNVDTSKVMKRLLQSDGYKVRTADSVASALQAADAEAFDLVICDIGLPDGSGLDLMRQLLSKRPIKAIAVSGFGMEEDIRRSMEAGFVEHLTKPVSIHQLQAAIRRHVADQQV